MAAGMLRTSLLLACMAVAGAQQRPWAQSHQQRLYSLLAQVQQADSSDEATPAAVPCAMGAGVVSVAVGCPTPLACAFPPCLPLPYPPAAAAPVAEPSDEMVEPPKPPSDEEVEAAIAGEKPIPTPCLVCMDGHWHAVAQGPVGVFATFA